MKSKRLLITGSLLLALLLLTVPAGNSLTRHPHDGAVSSISLLAAEKTFQPADLFADFPAVKWGMSFPDARKAIEKTGAHPVGSRDAETELVWDGTFNGNNGRATIFCKPGTGVWEIAVIAFAMDKQKEVFEAWGAKVTARHGAPKEIHDDSDAISKVWRLPDSIAIELRAPKDPDRPVVDIHWVQQ